MGGRFVTGQYMVQQELDVLFAPLHLLSGGDGVDPDTQTSLVTLETHVLIHVSWPPTDAQCLWADLSVCS